MEIQNSEMREKFRRTQYPELAPIEHKIIGSSPSVNGNSIFSYEFNLLVQKAREGDKTSYDKLVIPVFLQTEGKDSFPIVAEERTRRIQSRDRRGVPVIDELVQAKLAREGIELYFELNPMDKEGRVDPSWRIYLRKEDNLDDFISDPSHLKAITVMHLPDSPDSPDKFFALREFEEGKNYRTLFAKISPSTT